MEFDMTKVVEEITMQARENQEEFIFDTIHPYCKNILQMKINKEELKQILLNGIQKQQPCEDCISRDDAIELIASVDETNGNEPVFSGKQVIKMLKGLPSVTPQPKTGHWEDCSNGWMCSNCYKDVSHWSDFCPHCGAKMEESEGEE